MSLSDDNWPATSFDCKLELPEVKREIQTPFQTIASFIFDKYSNLTRLQRVVAWCLRFAYNSKSETNKLSGPLNSNELHTSLNALLKLSQFESFGEELNKLKRGSPVSHNSKILSLAPFLDQDDLLRVGGRLQNSVLSYHVIPLLFEREHLRLLHAGPQMLLASIRMLYWPTCGRDLARKIVHRCIRCCKVKPTFNHPLMGNLLESRVQPAPPFQNVGVDYAGPILVRDRKGRGCKLVKSYICVFVCFCTKAVHLELVSDLSTQAFLLSIKRFIARRGKPLKVFADNGSTFVGANSELRSLGQFLKSARSNIIEHLASDNISWRFIPARSPHFGGLWEASVKSVKYHLKRVVGNAHLTFEELTTLLTQIEAILNSRPLSPLSSDVDDLHPLTPSHFLIGRPLIAIPEPDLTDAKESRLTNFQRIQKIQQHFWRRWSVEYLKDLQRRTKWMVHKSNIKEGTLVLLQEENLPPLRWKLGRVVELFPGTDGIVRTVTIKTTNGLVKRAVAKICALPCE